MAVYICAVRDTPYDEEKEGVKWEDLPDTWVCRSVGCQTGQGAGVGLNGPSRSAVSGAGGISRGRSGGSIPNQLPMITTF